MLNEFGAEENLFGRNKTDKAKAAAKAGRKEKRTERRTKRKATVKKVAKKVGGAATKLLGLRKFAKPMEIALKRKGITPETDLADLAQQFYREVVKKNDYETALDFESGAIVATDYTNSPMYYENFDPVTITAVVNGIITYFKEVVAKKRKGEPLTKVQAAAASAAEEAEKQGTAIAIDEMEEGIGETVTGAASAIKANLPIIIGIVAIGLVAYFMSKR